MDIASDFAPWPVPPHTPRTELGPGLVKVGVRSATHQQFFHGWFDPAGLLGLRHLPDQCDALDPIAIVQGRRVTVVQRRFDQDEDLLAETTLGSAPAGLDTSTVLGATVAGLLDALTRGLDAKHPVLGDEVVLTRAPDLSAIADPELPWASWGWHRTWHALADGVLVRALAARPVRDHEFEHIRALVARVYIEGDALEPGTLVAPRSEPARWWPPRHDPRFDAPLAPAAMPAAVRAVAEAMAACEDAFAE